MCKFFVEYWLRFFFLQKIVMINLYGIHLIESTTRKTLRWPSLYASFYLSLVLRFDSRHYRFNQKTKENLCLFVDVFLLTKISRKRIRNGQSRIQCQSESSVKKATNCQQLAIIIYWCSHFLTPSSLSPSFPFSLLL